MRGLIGLLCLWLLAGAALPASAQSPVERGRYLVEVVGGCGNCHTPKGPEGDLPGKHLGGGFESEEAFGIWITPNITSDPETGLGRWTDDEVIRAIREGRGRDGKTLGQDALDPHLFPTTKRLLEGPTHTEAVELLDEFLAGGHALVRDPVKRAVLQRDLWAVFDWSAMRRSAM